ncbi:MAG: zinc ribbon domain-containing protein [Ectothiorhodospiraceae bacterium]|jgi:putative FmdB family regulatory protein
MPIYEYACQSCGHELEALQSISDEPLTECPQCGEPQLRKLISAAAFRLKGGGWYETDFKKDKRRNLAGDGEKSSSSSESKSDGGSGSGKSSSGETASKKSAQG